MSRAPTNPTGAARREQVPSFLFGMAIGVLIGYRLVVPARPAAPPRRREEPARPVPEPPTAPPPLVWQDRSDTFRPLRQAEVPRDALLWRSDGGVGVAVSRSAWSAMEAHVAGDLRRERLGLLVGTVAEDERTGQLLTIISEAVPVHSSDASPTRVALTHEAAPQIAEAMRRLPDHSTVVGWFHSHPGLGIFLSGTDMRTQRAYFSHDWQVAIVLDPVAHHAGVFTGARGMAAIPTRRDDVKA